MEEHSKQGRERLLYTKKTYADTSTPLEGTPEISPSGPSCEARSRYGAHDSGHERDTPVVLRKRAKSTKDKKRSRHLEEKVPSGPEERQARGPQAPTGRSNSAGSEAVRRRSERNASPTQLVFPHRRPDTPESMNQFDGREVIDLTNSQETDSPSTRDPERPSTSPSDELATQISNAFATQGENSPSLKPDDFDDISRQRETRTYHERAPPASVKQYPADAPLAQSSVVMAMACRLLRTYPTWMKQSDIELEYSRLDDLLRRLRGAQRARHGLRDTPTQDLSIEDYRARLDKWLAKNPVVCGGMLVDALLPLAPDIPETILARLRRQEREFECAKSDDGKPSQNRFPPTLNSKERTNATHNIPDQFLGSDAERRPLGVPYNWAGNLAPGLPRSPEDVRLAERFLPLAGPPPSTPGSLAPQGSIHHQASPAHEGPTPQNPGRDWVRRAPDQPGFPPGQGPPSFNNAFHATLPSAQSANPSRAPEPFGSLRNRVMVLPGPDNFINYEAPAPNPVNEFTPIVNYAQPRVGNNHQAHFAPFPNYTESYAHLNHRPQLPQHSNRTPNSYGQLPYNYGQPPNNYGQPLSSHGEVPNHYGQAPNSYGQASSNYSGAVHGYEYPGARGYEMSNQ